MRERTSLSDYINTRIKTHNNSTKKIKTLSYSTIARIVSRITTLKIPNEATPGTFFASFHMQIKIKKSSQN